ncbi:MAG: Ldh family oxidoreductase [Bryobacteraceae bacterium]|nr:Ldh family oxidoreductase [Bryobacteraceae bacterium]
MNGPTVIPHLELRQLAERILAGVGFPEAKAALVAESVVATSLRGVDSHGIHLLPHYVKQFRIGNIDPSADGHVVSESGACLLYDGEHGVGQHISAICSDHAVRLCREHGLGLAIARNSNHFGAAFFWARRISSHGLIGVVMSNASPSVPPWQGREGRVGTNPISVSVPSSGAGGWLLDMATTTVAMNKIVQAAANNLPTIPSGWAMDADGVPTTDTMQARRGLLMPLGGYKGSGLGMLVEILCGVLGGGIMSTKVGGLHITERMMNTSQMFLAIDIARFMPLEEFQSRMEYLVTLVKSAAPARDFSEVLVAGDPEWRKEAERRRDGIPVDPSTWNALLSLAAELGIPAAAAGTASSE